MSLADSIAPHLPYLRRFSRALTGSQQGGDAYVAAVLEVLIQKPDSIKAGPDVRVGLYQMFCSMWESVSLNLRPAAPAFGNPGRTQSLPHAERHLSAMPPKAREAFLLVAVEEFTPKEVARILHLPESDVLKLVDDASAAIVDQVATTVMIIEDEPLIAMDLRAIVESIGHTFVGNARTHAEAVKLATKTKPGLILTDIQLADGSSGLEAVNQILKTFEVPVIFVTAFPERLLTGVKCEPAFLITKPFMPQMVKAVVSQALFFGSKARAAA